MPITDLATNVILDNIGKVYFLKTGVYRDQVGLDNNHPLSSVSALLIHIEDGVPQNVMVANYAPTKMASWAAHDFPLWYRGQVEYTITGESAPRTFAQYFTYVPSILVAMNKNGTSIMDVAVTITQNTGANLLGGFADLTALNAEYPLTDNAVALALQDDLATAYVYDNTVPNSTVKGFYRVAWDGVSAWTWQLVVQALITYGVQTKQYNVLPIKVQRGYAPSQTPLSVSDEIVRLIYQEIAYINAIVANHTELIGDKVEANTYIVGATPFASDWLSLTVGGVAITPTYGIWYTVLTAGIYQNKVYIWNGSNYVLVSDNEAVGSILFRLAIAESDIQDILDGNQNITYDNAISGLSATTIKGAIDEIDANVDLLDTNKEDKANKVTAFQVTPTDVAYPSEKLVKDTFDTKEALANKAIDFSVVNDTLYPTVEATKEQLDLKEDLTNKAVNFTVKNDTLYPTVKAVDDEINVEVLAHNVSNLSHADIRALIAGLQGAFVYRGYILTYAGSEPTQSELTDRLTVLMSRAPIIGDVLIDGSEIEWYFDGTIWNNMGQAIIALASALNDGLMSSAHFTKLTDLPTMAGLTTLLFGKVDKVTDKSLVLDTLITKLSELDSQTVIDEKLALKLDKDISALPLFAIADTDIFVKRSADGTLHRITAQQAKDYFVSAGLTFDSTVNYMTNGLGAFKSAVVMAHPVTLQTNGDFRCTIRTMETNTILYVIFPTVTATQNLRVSANNGTTYYNVLKNGSTLRASIVSGQLVRLQFNGTSFIADIQGEVAIEETYTDRIESTYGSFAPMNGGSPLVKEISGRTIPALSNLVTNGNFASGTTGWTALNSTHAVSDSILSNTANGTIISGFTRQAENFEIGVYYTKIKYRVTNSLSTRLRLRLAAGYIDLDQLNPVINQWYTISKGGNVPVAINDFIQIEHTYANTTDATGAVMEVDYIQLFNLTASHGVTATTGTAYDNAVADIEAQLEANSGYISTTARTSVINTQVKATGKNLFDGVFTTTTVGFTYNQIATNQFSITSVSSTGTNVTNLFPNIKFKTATQYIFSGSIIQNTTGLNARLRVYYTDETVVTIYDPTTSLVNFTFTSASGKTISKIVGTYSNTGGLTTYTNFQIEEGTVATTYEAYVSETQLFTHTELHGLPNLVADKLRYDNGAYVRDKYVSEVTLTSGLIAALTVGTSVDRILVTFPSDFISATAVFNANISGKILISNYPFKTYADNVLNINTHAWAGSSTLYIVVATGTYASLAEAQTALAGTKILYQLATPLLANEVIDVDGTLIQGTVTTVQQLQNIPTTYKLEYAMNVEQTTKTLVERDKIQQTEIDSNEARLTALEVITAEGYDDLRFSATTLRQGATTLPDFDYSNIGLLFPQNNVAEIIYVSTIMPHTWKEGSTIYPHVHVRRGLVSQAVFKIDYKIYNIGETIPASWTTLTMNVYTASWTAGNIGDVITNATGISMTGKTSSCFIDLKLYRDDNVYTGDILVKEFDIHYLVNKLGSSTLNV